MAEDQRMHLRVMLLQAIHSCHEREAVDALLIILDQESQDDITIVTNEGIDERPPCRRGRRRT